MTSKRFQHDSVSIPKIKQINTDDGRLYDTGNGKYPSITTILSKTKDISHLLKWRKRVGEEEAQKITTAATTRGTSMHNLCENYLKNETLDDLGSTSGELLFRGIRPTLDRIDNVRCLEAGLYSHKLQIAGTVDCIAEFDGELAVIDFKTARKTKKKEWIEDYFMQGAFYFTAFHEITGELPKKIAILISVQDGSMQEFVISGREIINYTEKLKERIGKYYANHTG